MHFSGNKNHWLKPLALAGLLLVQGPVWAADGPPPPSSLNNPMALILVIIAVMLLLIIGLLAYTVMGAAGYKLEKWKSEEAGEKKSGLGSSVAALVALLVISSPLMAQSGTTATPVASEAIAGMAPLAFYLLTGVILVEAIVILVLLFNLKSLIATEKKKLQVASSPEEAIAIRKSRLNWWDRFNSFRPADQESQIDLGHNYDGIRELDNKLPPWWLYGFYITIVFAGIYLWQHHVSHSAPSSIEEFQIAMKEGDAQKALYLKNSANNVDENTVKLLTSPEDLAEGKKVFSNPAYCMVCHRTDAGGNVGPNLTDDYWIHGGSIKDLFKTIKYGYPDKGMKSWKDDLTPLQIAQVASYIKSLRGSNPPNPKEKQGDLYTEDGASPAPAAAAKDSTTDKGTKAAATK